MLDFSEVFAGGDCVSVQDNSLPPTAQVAYQQGAIIARNLTAIAFEETPTANQINIRGTLLKLGINNAAANLFNMIEVTGEAANLIRQGTYLTLLPTPIHDFKAATEWLDEEIFHHHINSQDISKKVVQAVEIVGAELMSMILAKKLLNVLGDEQKNQ